MVQMIFNDSLPSGAVSAGEADDASFSSLETAGVGVLAGEEQLQASTDLGEGSAC